MPLHIAIVEDEPAIAANYRDALQRRGFQVSLFHDQASAWAATHAGFEYIPVLSDPLPEDDWSGRSGFVHEAVLVDFPDLSPFTVYASGPPVMVGAGREGFIAHGLDATRFPSDSFDYAYEPGHDDA